MSEKIKVLQQVLDPSGSGGVSAEYRALQNSGLINEYDFVPMVLLKPGKGINFKDIKFYYKTIKAEKPDIVHIRGAAPDGLNAVIAAKLAGKCKILVTVHGMYSDLVYISRAKKWISKNIIERLTFCLSDGISCVCKNANDRRVFDKYRFKMLPYVYNRMPDYSVLNSAGLRRKTRQELKIDENTVVGIYVGRVTREKGMTFLKTAIEGLKCDFKMLIVGDGEYLSEFKGTKSENVIFLGNQTDVFRYLFAADFFVSPSLHENHSIALLEAAAASLPIIATNVGGNSEIVKDGTNGLLIEAGNSDLLAEAINKIALNKGLRESLSQKADCEVYSSFKSENIDKQLNSVYKQIFKN